MIGSTCNSWSYFFFFPLSFFCGGVGSGFGRDVGNVCCPFLAGGVGKGVS